MIKTERIYEDDDLIIVSKPSGVLVLPDRFDANLSSLHRMLQIELDQKLFVVHRIDRDTSGLICFAKNEATHRYMSMLFQEHHIAKYYAGIVHGRLSPESARIEAAIIEHPHIKGRMVTAAKGKASVTDYKVVEQWSMYALMQFQIHTGRTHQIRVHMQSIGHPIVCDPIYSDGKPLLLSSIKRKYKQSQKEEEERPLLNRLALHAYKLSFHKEDGQEITVEAPIPKDMAACITQLNKWASPRSAKETK